MAWNERVTGPVLQMALSQAWRTLARIKLLAGRHPLGRRVLVLRLSFMLAAFPLISLMQDTVVTASTIEDGRCLVCAARESVYSHPSQPDGPFTLQEPGGSHPLTAPCASPLINWVCSKRNVIVIGTVPINAPAAKMPQFTAKSFPI